MVKAIYVDTTTDEKHRQVVTVSACSPEHEDFEYDNFQVIGRPNALGVDNIVANILEAGGANVIRSHS